MWGLCAKVLLKGNNRRTLHCVCDRRSRALGLVQDIHPVRNYRGEFSCVSNRSLCSNDSIRLALTPTTMLHAVTREHDVRCRERVP